MIPVAKPYLTGKEAAAARRAILSGWVTQGPKVKEFEEAFAKYTKAKYACAVSNCTAALHLALLAVGVKPGDCVVTVSHSFIATANSIRYCGADPVFIDIDPATYNISPECLSQFLNKECRKQSGKLIYKRSNRRIAAILTVHQMGMPCDLKAIVAIAKKYRLPLVEDAACAVGSEISLNGGKTWEKIGKPHGDIACFSFHPRKLLTTGEGGMLTTNNKNYDRLFRLLRHQGMDISDLKRHQSKSILIEKYPIVGYNFRLTDIQASIGIEQLKKLPAMIRRRRAIARYYQKEFSRIPWLKVPSEPGYCRTNWQSFPVRIAKNSQWTRDKIMAYLLHYGISVRPGIMNAHEEFPYMSRVWNLPQSSNARRQTILLPMYHLLTKRKLAKIVATFKNMPL